MVEECGYTVLAASDVETALVLLRSLQQIDCYSRTSTSRPPFSVAATWRARPCRSGQTTRVLYTTGNSATDGLKALFVDGSQFIGKPYTPLQLQSSVKALLSTPI